MSTGVKIWLLVTLAIGLFVWLFLPPAFLVAWLVPGLPPPGPFG